MREDLAPKRFNTDLPGVRVVFAPGAILELPTRLEKLGFERAFLVTTGGHSSKLVPPQELLGDRLAEVFSGAKEHVPVATIAKALARFRKVDADVCVAIGGGSAIGLGKAIARETGRSLVAVPTTYSGSEMTSVWGQTDANGKQTGRDPKAKPRLVIYDVALTLGLPPDVSAASGMNAMAHAVEAMYAGNANDSTRQIAEEAIRLLAANLPAVFANGRDVVARSQTFAGAHLAGRALDASAMGLHHRICHVLGGTFKLPHAPTHACVLPHAVAFNTPAAHQAMTRVARAMSSSNAADALWELNRSIGLTATLRDLGLREQHLDAAAQEIAAGAYPNPRPASAEEIRAILASAFRGDAPRAD